MAKIETSSAKRKRRIRHKIRHYTKISNRPRLSVFRSGKHIYAQLIDDVKGNTLAASSSLDKEIKSDMKNGGNTDAAKRIGQSLAKKAKQAKITEVIFDRGSYLYHGRIKAVAEGAREGGLKF